MNTYSELKKKGKIKLYAKKLPYSLKKRFGKKDSYKQVEVDQALSDNFVDTVLHKGYSYAMFCAQDEFNRIEKDPVENDYDTMRTEIADICFHRPMEFSVNDIMEYASGDWGFVDYQDKSSETDMLAQ